MMLMMTMMSLTGRLCFQSKGEVVGSPVGGIMA